MKANEKDFLRFLEGADKHFVIPVYQRNYDWKKEQCKQLFDDLIDIAKNSFRTHFLGSIVSIYYDKGKYTEYLIIDGQQRLTTLSLLLRAIYKFIDEKKIETAVNKEQIQDEYLINKYSKKDKKIRLKPVKNDNRAFEALFENEEDYVENSNITINYQYFYDRIAKEEISVDDLFLSIKKLVIVEIELKNGEDNPQLIFESLNSTGLDLTEADKVRNFILMKEEASTQEEFYNDYWNKIEKNTNYNVSDFIRDYLTIKERVIPNKNKVYISFKKYALNKALDTKKLLIDLLKFSLFYKKIINAKDAKDKVGIAINRINRLKSVVTYPFIMEAFNDCEKGIINEDDLVIILDIILSFVFRRIICDVATNSLNKIFMLIGRKIKKHNDYQNNYLEIFKYIITKERLSRRFPDDNEFKSKLIERDIYNFNSKNKLFLLERLENFENKERVDVENLINDKELTIEHIMPQTINPKWKRDLGENWKEVQEKYLHTIGNITLTGYNSKMTNKPFLEKRDMEKGFKESRLFLNSHLHNLENWNEKTIKNRANLLSEKALKIWEYLGSSYKSTEKALKEFTLSDDDKNFAGEKIVSFKLLDNKEQEINHWKVFYKTVCSTLYELDPIKFKQIVSDNKFDAVANATRHIKIDNFYINGNLTAEMILLRLRTIIEQIGLDLDDLSFTIK